MSKKSNKVISAKIARLFFEAIPPYIHRMRLEVRKAAPESLSFSQFRVMACIFRGVQTVSLIAEQVGVSQPAMTKMVNGLVARDLIKKVPDKVDKRQSWLYLTFSGERLYLEVISQAEASLTESLKGRDQADLLQLEQSLTFLHQFKKDL
jgi:DNA-binding MarR family transcriptional regulator